MVHFVQNEQHFLAIANELSSTVSLYRLGNDGRAEKTSSLQIGSFGSGSAEIVAYDRNGKNLFVTGADKSIIVIDIATPAEPKKSGIISIYEHGDSIQSVAVKNGLVAIAVTRLKKYDALRAEGIRYSVCGFRQTT